VLVVCFLHFDALDKKFLSNMHYVISLCTFSMVLAVFTRDQSELIPYELMSLMKGTSWIDMLKLHGL